MHIFLNSLFSFCSVSYFVYFIYSVFYLPQNKIFPIKFSQNWFVHLLDCVFRIKIFGIIYICDNFCVFFVFFSLNFLIQKNVCLYIYILLDFIFQGIFLYLYFICFGHWYSTIVGYQYILFFIICIFNFLYIFLKCLYHL